MVQIKVSLIALLSSVSAISVDGFTARPRILTVSRRHCSVVAGTNLHAADTTIDEDQDASILRQVTFGYLDKELEPDILCELLLEVGSCATSIVDADYGTQHEVPIFGEPSGSDPWQESVHWAAPMWKHCNVTAYFPASVDVESVLRRVQTFFPSLSLDTYRLEQVPNKDWVMHVQKNWKPIVLADKFVLRFPWHRDLEVAKLAPEHAVILELQGGVAFGTGEHPTTQLCLEWIHDAVTELLEVDSKSPIRVLDYGSGSGVLGLAACALSRERVIALGVDIDVDACRIANANARRNNNLPMRNYLPPLIETEDVSSKSLLPKAHAYAREQVSSQHDDNDEILEELVTDQELHDFDVCAANILAAPLVTLAPTLASMVRSGARIGLSGILSPQADMVIDAYKKAGFVNVAVADEREGWILVTGVKG